MALQPGGKTDMGSIIVTIKKSDLSRHNVVKVDKSDTFRPYLLVNLDRAYIYLCGKEIIVESWDFVMTDKKSIIADYKKFWKTEHNKQNLSRQYRIVHNEVIAERDTTYYTYSTEVSEAEFMAEVVRRKNTIKKEK